MTEEAQHVGIRCVEGPSAYSPNDVARAFAAALGREVHVVEVPRVSWEEIFRSLGFSPAAAASYSRMTEITVDTGGERPAAFERGDVTLDAYVTALVQA